MNHRRFTPGINHAGITYYMHHSHFTLRYTYIDNIGRRTHRWGAKHEPRSLYSINRYIDGILDSNVMVGHRWPTTKCHRLPPVAHHTDIWSITGGPPATVFAGGVLTMETLKPTPCFAIYNIVIFQGKPPEKNGMTLKP